MTRQWRLIGRHRNWVIGANISEYIHEDNGWGRFTATIRGYGNWKIAAGPTSEFIIRYVRERVLEIRDRIDAGDEEIFHEENHWRCINYWKWLNDE